MKSRTEEEEEEERARGADFEWVKDEIKRNPSPWVVNLASLFRLPYSAVGYQQTNFPLLHLLLHLISLSLLF